MDSERLTRILIEVDFGKIRSQADTGEEAAYRERLVEQVAEIKAKGGTVDIPFELP